MDSQNNILQQLQIIMKALSELTIVKKDVLNFDEAREYLSISASHLYKMTSSHSITCYQPNGKKLYFKRSELDEWLLRNRKCASDEIEVNASNYILTSRKKGGLI